MFRKTRFNGQPELLVELKKEFSQHARRMDSRFQKFLNKYPRAIYACMLCSILLSAVLVFTVIRVREKAKNPYLIFSIPVTSTGAEIGQTSRRLQEVLDLQSQLAILLQQDTLGAADSLRIQQLFGRLEAIRKQENSGPNK